MYRNTEPKREIKNSHSMLLPKLVWELMAIRKQLPAPRKKNQSHLLELELFTNFMRREWDMNLHTAQSRFMGLGAVETVSRVWTDRLLAWCHKMSNLLAVPTAPLLRQTDNSFNSGEECHFGKQPAFSQRTTWTPFTFKQVCFLILWQRPMIPCRHAPVDFCDGSHRSVTSQSVGTPLTKAGIGVSPPLLTQP